MRKDRDLLFLRDYLKPALGKYAYVLIDLPGNIDRRSKLAVAALVMSDFVLIPVERSQISLNGLPDTFGLRRARDAHPHRQPPRPHTAADGAIVTIRYRDLQPARRWRRFRVVAFDLKAPHTCYVEVLDNRHVVYQVSGSWCHEEG